MIFYKLINKIKVWYQSYELRCQNKILNSMILSKNGQVGKDVKFGRNIVISGVSATTIVGNNVHIGTNGFIRADGGLKIGNNVFISRNVVLYTSSHNYKGELLPFDETNILKPVVIEDNVWIGMNVSIAPGTTIREGVIIGLGSTVFGEIPARTIIGSGKYKVLNCRDKAKYETLKNNSKFCKENGIPYINLHREP